MASTLRPARSQRRHPHAPSSNANGHWPIQRVARLGLATFCLGVSLSVFSLVVWQVHLLKSQVREHQTALQQVVDYINKQVEQGNQTPQQLQLLQQQIDQLHQSEPVVPTANTGSGSSARTSSSREARR
jgi:hypothetical protein